MGDKESIDGRSDDEVDALLCSAAPESREVAEKCIAELPFNEALLTHYDALNERERALVERHLVDCTACRRGFSKMRLAEAEKRNKDRIKKIALVVTLAIAATVAFCPDNEDGNSKSPQKSSPGMQDKVRTE